MENEEGIFDLKMPGKYKLYILGVIILIVLIWCSTLGPNKNKTKNKTKNTNKKTNKIKNTNKKSTNKINTKLDNQWNNQIISSYKKQYANNNRETIDI